MLEEVNATHTSHAPATYNNSVDQREIIYNELVKLRGRHIYAKILYVAPCRHKALGYFSPQFNPDLKIKCDISMDAMTYSEILTHQGHRKLGVGGKLTFDLAKLRGYIDSHQDEAFRNLQDQQSKGWKIPIIIEARDIIGCSNNAENFTVHKNNPLIQKPLSTMPNSIEGTSRPIHILPIPEEIKIVNHIKSLKGRRIIGDIMYFQPENKGGIARYDSNELYIRYLFKLPEEYNETPVKELESLFDQVEADIELPQTRELILTYIRRIGTEVFSVPDDPHHGPLIVRSSNSRLIKKEQ
ncbi:hypothetical protein [Endozoicomonas ascidiicola]|uniref:hypothetical protein n=1 Tax=Endozoicomonas ascidiicola TaxID=1698521 RepID=UPI000832C611|nr:hypothetical protein [Endozoicomonas ascidiicola]